MTDKEEQYVKEISQLVNTYGLDTIEKLLETSDRAIQYWVAGEKVPRAATRLKISELFVKHKSGQDLRKVSLEQQNGLKNDILEIEAKIDVLFDVAVELLSATSGESGTLIRKKLEKRVDELKKFSGQ